MEQAMTVFLFELSGVLTSLHIRATWEALKISNIQAVP